MAESATNVVVGYLINLLLVYVILHSMGYSIRAEENMGMGLIIASFSFFRGYWIRKIFSRLERGRSGPKRR